MRDCQRRQLSWGLPDLYYFEVGFFFFRVATRGWFDQTEPDVRDCFPVGDFRVTSPEVNAVP